MDAIILFKMATIASIYPESFYSVYTNQISNKWEFFLEFL